MKHIPKSILALAAQKPLPKTPGPKTSRAATIPNARSKTLPPIHTAATPVSVSPTQRKSVTGSHIELPKLPRNPAHSAMPSPRIHPFKVKTSAAMSAMAKLVQMHHIKIKPSSPKHSRNSKLHLAAAGQNHVGEQTKAPVVSQHLLAAVKEEKQQKFPVHFQKTEVHKNSMGVVDGSKNSWQPFVDKVPKNAFAAKRTFLPPTQTAFQSPKHISQTLKPVQKIGKELKEAEHIPKQKLAFDLKDSNDAHDEIESLNYSRDNTVLKPVKSWGKHDSLRWPFGRPSLTHEESLLQIESGEDAEDIGDTNDDEIDGVENDVVDSSTTESNNQQTQQNDLGSSQEEDDGEEGDEEGEDHETHHDNTDDEEHVHQQRMRHHDLGEAGPSTPSDHHDLGEAGPSTVSEHHDLGEAGLSTPNIPDGERQPIVNYDPIQDMLQANGWSSSMLQRTADDEPEGDSNDHIQDKDNGEDEMAERDETQQNDLGEAQYDDDDTNEGEISDSSSKNL